MRLNQIEYITEVAKCNSFSKAAKKLFISQPTLSTSISALEEEIGVTIFHRNAKGAFPTEEGEKILAQAEQVLAILENMKQTSGDSISPCKLTIAATPVACNSLTTELLKKLSYTHPEIQLNFIEMRPRQIISTMTSGMADIMIGNCGKGREVRLYATAQKHGYNIEPIFVDQFCVFVSRSHPMNKKASVSLNDFSNERQALFQDYLSVSDNLSDLLDESISGNDYIFSDRSSIKQVVAAGLAYAVFPQQMVLDDIFINSGLVKALPLSDNDATVTTYLAWRKGIYTPRQELIVLDMIRELYVDVERRLQNLFDDESKTRQICQNTDPYTLRY